MFNLLGVTLNTNIKLGKLSSKSTIIESKSSNYGLY